MRKDLWILVVVLFGAITTIKLYDDVKNESDYSHDD
jgi:hypothetical protein